MMRFINIFFYTIFVSLMLGVAGLLVGSMLPIPGNIELKIVKSGSMDPNIPTGSLVVVKPSANYSIGDVITFGADTKTEIPTTHRIIGFEADENGRTAFRTKGDANEDPDANPTQRNDVIGKVVFHVPYVGFVLDFARQPLGFALLIGVPAALVVLEEVMTIVKEVKAGVRRRKRKEEGEDTDDPSHGSGGTKLREVAGPEKLVYLRRRAMDEIFVPMVVQSRTWIREHTPAPKDVYGTATFVVLGIVFVSTVLSGGAQGTIAYFNDIERSIGNIFQAGEGWEETPPTNGDPQQIVLNEFLPAPDSSANGLNFGNDNSNMPLGEWIELYNMGTTSVDVNGWYFTDASGGVGNTHAVIDGTNTQPATTIIPPGGWLVVYLNKPTLNNTGDSIFLYTSSSTGSVLVDSYTYELPQPDGCELEPTPTSSNATSTLSGNPGNGPGGDCNPNLTPPNKSYARIPDGTGAFVDPIPTPGSPNIPEAEIAPAAAILSGSSSGEVQGASTEAEEPVEEPAEEPAVQPTEEPQTQSEEPLAESAGPEPESPQSSSNDAITPSETVPEEASNEPPAEDPTEETPAPGDVAPAEPAPEPAPDAPTE